MKKISKLSLFLCLCMLLQSFCLPAAALETTEAENPVAAFNAANQKLEFGDYCVQQGCRTIEGMVPLGGTDRKLATAQSVFLFETRTETVVYSYNPDMKVSPGNLAKIVTAIVTLEHAGMDEIVTCGLNVTRHGGSFGLRLKVEEELSVKDLLYGMVLAGAHDAAVALAEHVAGNQQGFVTLMNNWVVKAGCTNTSFASVHGLDTSDSYTTARDMVKIVMKAMENPLFEELFTCKAYTIGETNRSKARPEYKTQNYMMDSYTIQDFFDSRVKGGMQNYAESSGAHVICTMDNSKEDENGNVVEDPTDLHYVAVIMGSTRTFETDSWKTKHYGNFDEMTELLKYAFESFKVRRIIYEGMALSQFAVAGGESHAIGVAMENVDSVVHANAHMKNLTMNFEILDGGQLSAPIAKDQKIATMSIGYRDSIMAEVEVFAMGDVKDTNNSGVTIRSSAVRSDSDASGVLSVIGTICVIILGLAAAYLAFNAYMRSRIRAQRRRRRAQRRRMR